MNRWAALMIFAAFPALSASAAGTQEMEKAPPLSAADRWTKAKLIEPKECSAGGCSVSWKVKTLEVETDDSGEFSQPAVILQGRLNREGWGLTHRNSAIVLDPQTSEFSMRIVLQDEITKELLYAVGPFGEIEEVHFVVLFDGLEVFRAARRKEVLDPEKTRYSATLGLGRQSYSETGVQPIEQTSLSTKLSFQNPWEWPWSGLASNWMVGASTALTLFPLSTNRPDTEIRFLDASMSLGYRFDGLPNGWGLTFWGGFYYTTMMVSVEPGKNSFGLQNLTGPQFIPTLSKKVSVRSSVSVYAKVAPIASEGLALRFPSRELAIGLSYTRALKPVVLTVSLDFARMNGDIAGSSVESTSSAFNLGLSW
ncbi:MAG: hypothetical protein A2X94_15285 [Bdellovibrionales bacterium GWB1_55_8]|nr:MAG: hypothetical protein A2X94_15285 [Bdellovibrionales bacterium GWB1_55_8]